MKTRSFGVARAFWVRERVRLSRRERENRSTDRLLIGVAALVLVAAASAVIYLSPAEKPVVTVYMRPGCDTCRSWMRYLTTHGFRAQLGEESDWPAVRARFKLPARFRGRHTAVVSGLLLEGHVPAREIHAVLSMPEHAHVRGLVVPGLPRGAPGLQALSAEPYVVFAMQDSGLMRPISTHHHDIQ
jgi:hypothetical protein